MASLILTPVKYHLETLMEHLTVTVVAVEFRPNGLPKKWAVYCGNSDRLNNQTGQFDFEPSPSNRDKEYIKLHSFNSADQAAYYYGKSRNTRKKEYEYYKLYKK